MVDIITYGANYFVSGLKILAVRNRAGLRKWNVIESVFFILLVLVTGYILLRSPLFEVKRVVVQGNQYLSEEKIRSVVNIGMGTNIFKLDLATASSNLKLLPMIKEVDITRYLPSSVVISIKERNPIGLLPTKDGFIEVDEEGVYLMKANAGIPGLPVITGVQADISGPGQPVRAERLENALAVLSGLPREAVMNLSEVNVDGNRQIIIYTIEGIQCRFGLAADIQEKGEVLSQLLLELRKQGAKVRYIDLSSADQPVVSYKKN